MSSVGQLLEYGTTLHSGAFPGEARWFAVQTRSRHEKVVTSQFEDLGITTFLPLVSRISYWSDRRKLMNVPLFPGYVFVCVIPSPEARAQILRTRGVVSLVGVRGEGTPIPDSQIDSVQRILAHHLPLFDYPSFSAGQRVRIRGGCMDGVEGILVGRNGQRKLVISIETIGRSLAIEVSGFDVETI